VTERPTRLPISPTSISTVTHLDFLNRAWKLRQNVTAYDAMYIALGEALDAPIVTCDAPLGRAPGHRTHIEVIA
jgi:predicted nucleic acid-binding protein